MLITQVPRVILMFKIHAQKFRNRGKNINFKQIIQQFMDNGAHIFVAYFDLIDKSLMLTATIYYPECSIILITWKQQPSPSFDTIGSSVSLWIKVLGNAVRRSYHGFSRTAQSCSEVLNMVVHVTERNNVSIP